MAFDFLGLSETYRDRTDAKIRRQREAVCRHMTEKYTIRQGRDSAVFDDVKAELTIEGIEFTNQDFRYTKEFLRAMFLWLTASSDAERTAAIRNARGKAGEIIELLRTDNINNWADVVSRAPSGSVFIVPSYTGIGGSDETVKVEAPRVVADWRTRLRELGAGDELLKLLDGLWPAIEAVFEENRALKELTAQAASECDAVRGELRDARVLIEILEGDNQAFQARLDAAHEELSNAYGATLEKMATQYPDMPQFFAFAQQLKHRTAKKEEELQALAARLPKSFTWSSESGTISYKRLFLRLLVDLSTDDQERFVRQLEMLAKQGWEYASLHTQKYDFRPLPHTPAPCFASRGTDEWRFSWTKNGGITVHWLGRKSDTRLRQSEA